MRMLTTVLSLTLSYSTYANAGGISGGTGAKIEDMALYIESLPKLPLDPTSFNRLRMRLHANAGQASMLIGNERVEFKTLSDKILDKDETLEAIEHPGSEAIE